MSAKNSITKPITHTSPHPHPLRTSNGPAPITVIQVIKHYPVQKLLPVYTIPLSTEPHKPLDSGCKKYPRPPHPPRVDWNVQLPGETPSNWKYSETSRNQSVEGLSWNAKRNHRRHSHLPFRWKFRAVHWRATCSTSYVEGTQRKGNLISYIFVRTSLTRPWNNSIRYNRI